MSLSDVSSITIDDTEVQLVGSHCGTSDNNVIIPVESDPVEDVLSEFFEQGKRQQELRQQSDDDEQGVTMLTWPPSSALSLTSLSIKGR